MRFNLTEDMSSMIIKAGNIEEKDYTLNVRNALENKLKFYQAHPLVRIILFIF